MELREAFAKQLEKAVPLTAENLNLGRDKLKLLEELGGELRKETLAEFEKNLYYSSGRKKQAGDKVLLAYLSTEETTYDIKISDKEIDEYAQLYIVIRMIVDNPDKPIPVLLRKP